MENNELMVMGNEQIDYAGEIIKTSQNMFCSMKAESQEEKVQLFNALNGDTKPIKDMVNTELMIKDVFIETVECRNEETGEITVCPRTVLIDTKGNGYTAVSIGVFSSLKKLFQIFGEPTWEKGLCIVPKIISKDKKSITTLTVRMK